MFTVTLHSDEWVDRLNKSARAFKRSVADELHIQAGLWVRQAMNFTPPTRGRLPGGARHVGRRTAKQELSAGENAVRRDVIRAATPADPDWVDGFDIFKKPSVRRIILSGDVQKFSKLLSRLTKLKDWQVKPFSPWLHQGVKDRRGRVTRSQKVFIIGTAELAAYWRYLTRQVSHVGRLKAGWLPSYLALGGKRIPRFVRRHLVGARGSVQPLNVEAIKGSSTPTITVANYAAGAGDVRMTRIASETFRARAQAMKRRMRLHLANFSSAMRSRVIAARTQRVDIDSVTA